MFEKRDFQSELELSRHIRLKPRLHETGLEQERWPFFVKITFLQSCFLIESKGTVCSYLTPRYSAFDQSGQLVAHLSALSKSTMRFLKLKLKGMRDTDTLTQ